MIKILCCEYMVQKLISEGRFFKFSLDFKFDCEFDEKFAVLRCSQQEFFFRTSVNIKKNCTCTKQFTCGFCLSRLFMLNHTVYKVCINDHKLVDHF